VIRGRCDARRGSDGCPCLASVWECATHIFRQRLLPGRLSCERDRPELAVRCGPYGSGQRRLPLYCSRGLLLDRLERGASLGAASFSVERGRTWRRRGPLLFQNSTPRMEAGRSRSVVTAGGADPQSQRVAGALRSTPTRWTDWASASHQLAAPWSRLHMELVPGEVVRRGFAGDGRPCE
jgi:hypothetical protein